MGYKTIHNSIGTVHALGLATVAAFSIIPLATAATGANLSIVHQFNGTDGKQPNELTLTSDGSIYGTTNQGGQYDDGVLFKVNSQGTYSLIREFNVDNFGGEGGLPTGWVGVGNDDSIYGTTTVNFPTAGLPQLRGTIYRLKPDGSVSIIAETGELGVQSPITKFTFKADGSVYGAYNVLLQPSGSYFKYVPYSEIFTLTTLEFTSGTARNVNPGLILGGDGNLYGVTQRIGFTFGTIFKIDSVNTLSDIYNFDFQTPELGYVPNTLINEDSAGNLYGTTHSGGNASLGVAYKLALNTDGTRSYSVLHHFDEGSVDPATGAVVVNPNEAVPGNDGNVYGTTGFGGAYDYGVLYQIDPNGLYSVLHHFTQAEGHPGNVVVDSSGSLFVPTSDTASQTNAGAIYKITLTNLNLPATTTSLVISPSSAVAGQPVTLFASVSVTDLQQPFPTGSVAFYDGAKHIGTAPLENGTANLTVSTLAVGTHNITARYTGDSVGAASNSTSGSITISPANNAPVAVDDVYTLVIRGKTPVAIAAPGVLANDTDAEGDQLSVRVFNPAEGFNIPLSCGNVLLYADGHFTFTPNKKGTCKAPESFSYYIFDGQADSRLATVKLNFVRR